MIILSVLSTVGIVCFFGCNYRKSEDEIARNLIEVNAKVKLPTDWLNVNSFESYLDKDNSKRFELFFSSALSEKPDIIPIV